MMSFLRRWMDRSRRVWVVVALAELAACGGGPEGAGMVDDLGAMGSVRGPASDAAIEASPVEGPAACNEPAEGCPCSNPAQTAECRSPTIRDGTYTYCLRGYRACQGGAWGPCILPTTYDAKDGG